MPTQRTRTPKSSQVAKSSSPATTPQTVVVPSSPGTTTVTPESSVESDFDLLASLHRSKSPRLQSHLLQLRLKYESMERLPEKYSHFIRYNLGLYHPRGSHVVIVDVGSLPLSPSKVAAGSGSGSEEALITVAALLADRGFRVTIFCNLPPESGLTLGSANPRYYPMSGLPSFVECVGSGSVGDSLDNHVHLCLAWRRTDFWRLHSYLRCPIVYCPHDWYSSPLDTTGLSGVAFLTEYQAKVYREKVPTLRDLPQAITGNGFHPEDFEVEVTRDPLLCGYYSAYHRGLEGVLKVWPEVRKAHPGARLEIYYGRENWGLLSAPDLQRLVSTVEGLKEQGVTERGRVPHRDLAIAMKRASLFVTASHFPETYGIVHVKAMAAGTILVGTNVIDSSLVPPELPLLDHNSPTLERDLASTIVARLNQALTGDLEPLRVRCQEYVREHHTWAAGVGRLVTLLSHYDLTS